VPEGAWSSVVAISSISTFAQLIAYSV